MKLISFHMTTDQVVRHAKAITRRFGWDNVKPDEHLQGVNQCQGLKPGQHPVKLAEIIVLDSKWEPVDEIIRRPVRKAKSEREWRAFQRCCSKHDEFWAECIDMNNLGDCCEYRECLGIPEVVLEGFPLMTTEQFVEMLIKSKRGSTLDTPVNRITFEYAPVV